MLIALSLTWLATPLILERLETTTPLLKKFSSIDELKSFLNEKSQFTPLYGQPIPKSFAFEATAKSSLEVEYSKTNIQVAGVDEADIVKTDGKYLYIASKDKGVIVRAYPSEDAKVLSVVPIENHVTGLFINDDRLAIIEEFLMPRNQSVSVRIYDVSNKSAPVLRRVVTLDGWYLASRMIGDYIYIIAVSPAYLIEDNVKLPRMIIDSKVFKIKASEIYYYDTPDSSYAYTLILAVNIKVDEEKPNRQTFLIGSAGSVYVSLNNLYLAVPNWRSFSNEKGMSRGFEVTVIHRVRLKDGEIEYMASGEVPGRVLNQFSMDEYEGYFRIATTLGWNRRNDVYILNMDLNVVSKIEGLAPGERIYSARFMGHRCYLVTFKKVDPFFVIDLTDPYNPKVLGWLKISGYSSYLHPYGENFIIGIGKETVEASEGNFAWYQGVKISLFNVTDVKNPEEVSRFIIGDRGTESPVLNDHKALLFDRSRNLMVIPVLVAEVQNAPSKDTAPNMHGNHVWQGAYVFNVTVNGGIELRGRITHIEGETMKSLFESYFVKRTVFIDDVLYTISDKKIKMNSLQDLAEIKTIEL